MCITEDLKITNPDLQTLSHFSNIEDIQLRTILNNVPKSNIVNPDNIYKSLLLNTSLYDSSKINVNKYGKLGYKLTPISEPFCDNILIAALVPAELIINKVNSKVAAQKKALHGWITDKNITTIKLNHLTPNRLTVMDGLQNRFVKPTDAIIKKMYHKYDLEYNKDTAVCFAQYYTIELSNLDFKAVLT